MEHYSPIITTILWVSLFAGIVTRFHKSLDDLLKAVVSRLNSGAAVKVAGFELAEAVRELTEEETEEKLEAEVQQVVLPETIAPSQVRVSMMEEYRQAEELALSRVGGLYGTKITKNVSLGGGQYADGFFVLDNVPHIVEVKLFKSRMSYIRLRDVLNQFLALKVRLPAFSKAKFILAIVSDDDKSTAITKVSEMALELGIDVDVRLFNFSQLQKLQE